MVEGWNEKKSRGMEWINPSESEIVCLPDFVAFYRKLLQELCFHVVIYIRSNFYFAVIKYNKLGSIFKKESDFLKVRMLNKGISAFNTKSLFII